MRSMHSAHGCMDFGCKVLSLWYLYVHKCRHAATYTYIVYIYNINTSKFYDGHFAASPYICWQNYWFPCWLSLHWTPIVMAPPSPSDLRSEDPVQRYPPEPMRPKARLRLRELSLESVVRGVHGRFHGYNTHIHTHIYIYIYISNTHTIYTYIYI